MDDKLSGRKREKGVVLSNGMDKTVVVAIRKTIRHPKYNKVVKRQTKVYAHVPEEKVGEGAKPYPVGARVIIEQTRPWSKLKRWRVVGSNVETAAVSELAE